MSEVDTTEAQADPGSASVSSGAKKSHFYEREAYIRILKDRLDTGEQLSANELMWLGSVAPNIIQAKQDISQPLDNTSWFKLGDELKTQIAELQKRSERFLGLGIRSFVTAFLMLGVSGALYLLANWFEPSSVISNVDVPDAIKELYSNAVQSSFANSNPFDSAFDVLGGAIQFVKPLLMIVTLPLFLFGLFRVKSASERDEPMGSALMALIFPLVLFGGFNLLFGVTTPDDNSRPSPQKEFLNMVASFGNENGLKAVEDSLKKHGANDAQIAYITAQMIVARHSESSLNPACCEEKNVLIEKANILKSNATFTALPNVIYAIDKMTFGKPVNDKSIAYEASTIIKANAFRNVSKGVLTSCVGMLIVGVFAGLFGNYLRRRLSRIRALYPVTSHLGNEK